MLSNKTMEEPQYLAPSNHFRDGIDDMTTNKENILKEVIWSTGILNTTKKPHTNWVNSLETPPTTKIHHMSLR